MDSSYRIKEITNNLESTVKATIGAKFGGLRANLSADDNASALERVELVNRLQQVVDAIQIAHLYKAIEILSDDVFAKAQPQYYIIVDKLDESWVEERVRYRLIRALIETIRDLAKIECAKIIVSIRRDLLDRVVRVTRDEGFQEEKYRTFYLQLKWSETQLLQLLDLRIHELVRRQYTAKPVSYSDLLPPKVGDQKIEEYLTERTLYRPRDILTFFNFLMAEAVERPNINVTAVRTAEGNYSEDRFRSIGDEWYGDYPTLLDFARRILRQRPKVFVIGSIADKDIEDVCLDIVTAPPTTPGRLFERAYAVAEIKTEPDEFRNYLFWVFYLVGLVGLKTESILGTSWAFRDGGAVKAGEVSAATHASICPAYFRVLGVNPYG